MVRMTSTNTDLLYIFKNLVYGLLVSRIVNKKELGFAGFGTTAIIVIVIA